MISIWPGPSVFQLLSPRQIPVLQIQPTQRSTDPHFLTACRTKCIALSGSGQSWRWQSPSKNTDISTYPAWTGIQNLPGYNYQPTATDIQKGLRNGVYQDFANFIRTYPTRWNDVRASRVNEANIGLYKNMHLVQRWERMNLQLRFDAFNVFNHPRFDAPNTNPGSSNFGRATAAQVNNARLIELGGRLTF